MMRRGWLLVSLLCSLFAGLAAAAVPPLTTVEGVLRGAGGGPVADGDYKLAFALYAAASGGTPLWQQAAAAVTVQSGGFEVTLGQAAPLDAKLLAGGALWLGVSVEGEAELPRRPLRSVPFALRASVAEGLDCVSCVGPNSVAINYAAAATKGGPALDLACTGCVSVSEMKFDGDLDLGGNSLKAGSATFGGDVVAKTVTATAFVGDGRLQCKSVAEALPQDALDDVSGGMLTTQFVDTVGTAAGVAIPDNTGASAFAKVTLADLGSSQGVTISVAIENTDLSAVAVKLLPPDDKKVGITLCDPCGSKDSKSFSATFPQPTAPKSGDLTAYLGNKVVGEWTLVVTDTSFCIKQAPGNAALCDLDNKIDGQIKSFSVTSKTLSSTKVAAKGLLQLQLAAKAPQPCGPNYLGALYFDTTVAAVRYCDGKAWRNLADTCGNGILDQTEECDDGNNTDGDGCSATCTADYGYAAANPAKSCLDLLTVAGAAGAKPADGVYWLDPDGAGGTAPFRARCDMTSDGGGWTLALKSLANNADWHYASALWTGTALLAAEDFATDNGKNAKYPAFQTLAVTSMRITLGAVTKVFTLSAATKGKTIAQLTSQAPNTTVGTEEDIAGKAYTPTSYWGLNANGHEAYVCSKLGFVYDTYPDQGSLARLGFGLSQEYPCGHNGTAEGFGLLDRGSDGDNLGSGRLQWGNESNQFAPGLVWVR